MKFTSQLTFTLALACVGISSTSSIASESCSYMHCQQLANAEELICKNTVYMDSYENENLCSCKCLGFVGSEKLLLSQYDTLELENSNFSHQPHQPFNFQAGNMISHIHRSKVMNVELFHMELSNQQSLTASEGSLFILDNNSTESIENLQAGDQLLDKDFHTVEVVSISRITYNGYLYHFETNPQSNLIEDHFLVINDIISADLYQHYRACIGNCKR